MKNIETKFNVNDKVWILDGKKARQLSIYSIKMTIDLDKDISIQYYFNKGTEDNFKCMIVNESECFTTLDELINFIKS